MNAWDLLLEQASMGNIRENQFDRDVESFMFQYNDQIPMESKEEELCFAALCLSKTESEYHIEPQDHYSDNSFFIDAKQRELNFTYFLNKILNTNSIKYLGYIGFIIFQRQKRDNFFFPAGKSKEFWLTYNNKKANLSKGGTHAV